VTTREGHKWLVVYSLFGPYVVRRDSPAAEEARECGAPAAKFRTLGGAYARLRRDLGFVVQSSP
jgi:hypothetical protein